MRIIQKFILLFLCETLTFYCYSQDHKQVQLELKVGKGAVLPHYEFMNFLIDEGIHNIECNIQFKSYGETVYDQLYNYPSTGFGINYSSLGNADKLGNALTAFGIFNMPLYTKNNFGLDFQVDFGLAYLNNSLQVNPYNTILSSPVSFYAGFDLFAVYNLKNYSSIKFGFELSHMSNGKTSTPNLGLNSFAITAAYSYAIKPRYGDNNLLGFKNDRNYNVKLFGAFGRKTDDFLTDKYFKTNSVRIDFEYIPSFTFGYNVGIDYFYDESIKTNKTEAVIVEKSKYGVHAGVGLHYNKLAVYIQRGKYIGELVNNNKYFNRVAVTYSPINRLHLQIAVKTHGATADFLELGVGYTIISHDFKSFSF